MTQKLLAKIALAFLIAFPSADVALADEPVPSAEDLVRRARTGRNEYNDVAFELRSALPRFRDKPQFHPYVLVLDDLLQIQKELNFASSETSIVDDLAQRLTRSVEPFMNVNDDDEQFMTKFLRWTQEDIRMKYSRAQQDIIKGVGTKAELMEILRKLSIGLEVLEKPGPTPYIVGPSYAIPDFEKLQGVALRGLVKNHRTELEPEEFESALVGVRSSQGLADALEELRVQVYLTTDGKGLRDIMSYSFSMRERMRNFTRPIPTDVYRASATVLGDALMKMLQTGNSASDELTQGVFTLLDPTQVDGLGQRLAVMKTDLLNDGQLHFVGRLARLTSERYSLYGMTSEQKAMEDLSERILLGENLVTRSAEGAYEVDIGDERWFLGIARTGPLSIAVSLGRGPVKLGFHHGRFNGDLDAFEVNSVAQGGGGTATNRSVRLRIGDNSVDGDFHNGSRHTVFNGRRTARYQNFFEDSTARANVPPLEGEYTGTTMGRDFRLSIQKSGSSYISVLTIDPETTRIRVPMEMCSFSPRTGVVYLTTRDQAGENGFLQVRGRLSGDKIVGEYIIGHKGVVEPLKATKSR